MVIAFASRWWTLAARGIAAILFGILTFISPGLSLFALVMLFGAWALADGVFNLVMALRTRKGERWGWLVLEGVTSILVGILTFFWPGITALSLLFLIAAWSVVTGIAELVAAVRLRKVIQGEWLLGLSGVLSIVFGLLLFAFPGAGALAVIVWIGAYSIVFGALLVALAFRLRAWARDTSHHVPPDQAPAPA
jgi:uncharacterized membrane protein HdeD (DUF308 family)